MTEKLSRNQKIDRFISKIEAEPILKICRYLSPSEREGEYQFCSIGVAMRESGTSGDKLSQKFQHEGMLDYELLGKDVFGLNRLSNFQHLMRKVRNYTGLTTRELDQIQVANDAGGDKDYVIQRLQEMKSENNP